MMTTEKPVYTTTSRDLIRTYNDRTQGEGHFFDADTMRFFKSRILQPVYILGNGYVFVTSERNEGMFWNGNGYTHYDEGRKYTVRLWDGHSVRIDNAGEFQEHTTSRAAHKAAQAYVKEHTA